VYFKTGESSGGFPEVSPKFKFKFVFESDQFVLIKGGAFVGKGYLFEGMLKLNLINKVDNYAYMIDSISLCHNRF
jgi:hypothetical protein